MTLRELKETMFSIEQVSIWKGEGKDSIATLGGTLLYRGQIGDIPYDKRNEWFNLTVEEVMPYVNEDAPCGVAMCIGCR